MTERTHFVYRVYDEHGLLLYVGCTKNPENRYKQHRGNKAPWLAYMATARLEGPYAKAAALAQERSVIETEAPYFNSMPAHVTHNAKRRAMRREMLADLRARKPELWSTGREYDPIRFAEFSGHHSEIDRAVDKAIPAMDAEWRHDQYLSARRLVVVKSA